MNQSITKSVLCTALLAAVSATPAQDLGIIDTAITEIELPPRYQVELVVFMNLRPSPGNESFMPRSDPMAWEVFADDDDALAGEEGADEAVLEPLDAPEVEIVRRRPTEVIVDPERMQLTAFSDRIRTSRDYRLIAHQAWIQDGLPGEEAETVFMAPTSSDDGVLDGSATLSVGRYPHLKLDLRWLPGGSTKSAPLYPSLSDLRDMPVPYQISQSSRVTRTGVPHYFDHPYFGVIATVWAMEEPELDEFGNPVDPGGESELTGSRR